MLPSQTEPELHATLYYTVFWAFVFDVGAALVPAPSKYTTKIIIDVECSGIHAIIQYK